MITAFKRTGMAMMMVVALASAFSACKHSPELKKETKAYCIPDSLLPNVTIDTVRRDNVQGEVILTGQITVDQEKQVRVFPIASGSTKQVFVELGDYVKQGQLLALIHSPDVAGLLSAAYTSVRDLDIAKKQLEQTEALYKSGLASGVDYITAKKSYEKQVSVTKMNDAILKIYGGDTTNLSDYYIKAPVSGYIVEKGITTGTAIRSDNGNDLFTIADLSEVWAVPNIFEADISKIRIGSDVDVTCLSYGDKEFKGKIDKLFNIVTPDTKVMNVRIKLQNPDNLLKPGMFAHIVVSYPEAENLLSISSSAVIYEDNQNYVLLYRGKCDLQIQPITVYKTVHGRAYIKGGDLHEGDVVVNRHSIYILTDIINMK